MAVKKLIVQPAFYRRLRHYRDRIRIRDARPQVAVRFVRAVDDLLKQLLENPRRGHLAGFETDDLADILRAAVPGFSVFALFYRWDGEVLTIITVEHTAQDLPPRLAAIISTPR
jgi:plasmid stabilization system protein ParE